MKATLILRSREIFADVLIEMVAWQLPSPVPACSHYYKYRFYAGLLSDGCLIRYDNERHKGDLDIWKGTRNRSMSIRALAKMLQRHYKNVYDDVKLLKQIGLIEKDNDGLFSVPWDEVTASFRLAA